MSHEIVAVDIGGTNARFCRARISKDGPPLLGAIRKYRVAEHATLADAWRHFEQDEDAALPDEAVIALAAPVTNTPIKLTNSHWVVDPDGLKVELGLDQLILVNDFEAMAYGIMAMPQDQFTHVCGPDSGMPTHGAVSIVGPGTGLGVGLASCGAGGVRILPTEGGHLGFAPVDEADDKLLAHLRDRFERVSVERVVSGPGLGHIHAALVELAGQNIETPSDALLWEEALKEDGESFAVEALSRLCRSYGTVAGDVALAHGASAVVLAGGLTGRMKDKPVFAEFQKAFLAKGRHRHIMEKLPIYHADHPEPGLFGAAAAGAAQL